MSTPVFTHSLTFPLSIPPEASKMIWDKLNKLLKSLKRDLAREGEKLSRRIAK